MPQSPVRGPHGRPVNFRLRLVEAESAGGRVDEVGVIPGAAFVAAAQHEVGLQQTGDRIAEQALGMNVEGHHRIVPSAAGPIEPL